MEENGLLGADAGTKSGSEGVEPAGEIVIDTSRLAAEISVLEEKMAVITEQVTEITAPVKGCYYMLIILVVLSLRRVMRGIIRKTRGGQD